MNQLKKAPITYLLLVLSLSFSLVGCSSATSESYNQEIRDYIEGFQSVQTSLTSASGSFAKDFSDSDATKELQNALKECATYIRKAEKLKAPSQLKEVQENLSSAANGAADSIDDLVKILGLGVNESNLTDFNKFFTTFNDDLTSFSKNLNSALGQSTPAG